MPSARECKRLATHSRSFLFTFEDAAAVALMKRTMRLPLSACDVDVRLWGRGKERAGGRGLTRIFRAKRRLVSRAFMTLAEGRTGEQEKHRPRCVGGGGADGRAERPASWADLYRLRDRNSDALHSFMCLVRASVRRLSRPSFLPSHPDPFYFSFSRGEIAFTRLHSVSLSVRLPRLLRPPSTQFPAGEEKVTMRKI